MTQTNEDSITYKVSVIVPTYNRLARLKKVLIGLEQQTYPLSDFEVIIVSDGSTDGTHQFLETIETPLQLKFIEQANQGVSVARNHGVDEAIGDMIVFLDDDVVPQPQLIVEHLKSHDPNKADAVVLGPYIPPLDFKLTPWSQWEQDKLLQLYAAMVDGSVMPSERHYVSGNSSLPRRLIIDAGGFDPDFRRYEDLEFSYRLKKQNTRFLFNEKAGGYHYSERSFASWLDIPYVYGRNDVLFTKQKDHGWLLPTVLRESTERHSFVRALVWLCLDRPFFSKMSIAGLKMIGKSNRRLGLFAYSGIFNLRYYQGIADELGGRSVFYKAIAQAIA